MSVTDGQTDGIAMTMLPLHAIALSENDNARVGA